MADAKKEMEFGLPQTTCKGILLDTEFLHKRNPDVEYGKDRFMVQFGIPKDANIKKLKAEIDKLREKVFPKIDPATLDMPFSDGDEKSWEPGHGMFIIKPKASKNKPIVVDANKEDIEDVASTVDNGMWARLRVTPMSFNKSAKVRGITLGLKMAQVYTGEPFDPISGRETANDAFDEDDDQSAMESV